MVNKILYMQFNSNGGNKNNQQDVSIDLLLKNEKLQLSEKSSLDKLMVSEDHYASEKPIQKIMSSRQNARPHLLELEKTRSTPCSMRKSSLK